ncbi:MAG: DUF1266 domain-containing protein [Sandaracinaceae bacterium]|jgi:hypothetical protein|nr:DUF1266 domain-containing protein [Sandaracinaceae bacterium]MBP7682228.1 DUF1266 domain-containing protein [Deltaproteobacteria bacterium]MBK6808525.1 DUF1266 domain-containing protein [Sandaracinaceae bacterium]MBK7154325.1 DUF1266 domain-containing protein [Sandaracinaceae bacterium]MBK7774815.1 DUF1266 domain-containing protein [Sandaracinaceae bacterium]
MNPIDTMDSGTLTMAVLIVAFAVFAIFATLGWLYFQSRVRAARAARWLAGAYGTWTGLEDSGTWERSRATSSLRSWYGVESQADLDALLEDLVRSRQTGNPAWDAGRGADTVRIGFAAGYLSASDVKDWTFRIAEVLQDRYASWQQYATAFEGGMHAWQDRSGVQDAEARGRVQRNVSLLVAQVWPAVDFKTPFE